MKYNICKPPEKIQKMYKSPKKTKKTQLMYKEYKNCITKKSHKKKTSKVTTPSEKRRVVPLLDGTFIKC